MSEAIADPISIDVVIPVWNDEAALSRTLPRLLQEWSPYRIHVVDGGSSDGSSEIARRYGVRLTDLPAPSRARQMNAGAAACAGDAVLFLHADAREGGLFRREVANLDELPAPRRAVGLLRPAMRA